MTRLLERAGMPCSRQAPEHGRGDGPRPAAGLAAILGESRRADKLAQSRQAARSLRAGRLSYSAHARPTGRIMRALTCLLAAVLAGCATAQPPGADQTRVAVDSAVLRGRLALEDERPEDAAARFVEAARLADDAALAERATRMAHELALTDLGLEAVERWQALAPDNARAHWFEGVFHTRKGRPDRAVEAFDALVAGAAPEAPGSALTLVVEALVSEPDTADATRIMQRLAERYPDTAEGRYGLARLAMRSGDFELALENAAAATELDPEWVDAQLLHARTLLTAGRTERSLELAAALAEEHAAPEVQLQYAELLLSAGRSDQAESRLDALLDENPGMPDAIRALGFLKLTTEHYDEARQHFNTLRGYDDYRNEAFYYLGRIAEQREQHLQATRSYSRVTQGTNAVEAQVRTALITLTQLNDLDGALGHLEEFGNANPQFSSDMLLARGQLLLEADEPERAMQVLEDALAERPDNDALGQAHVQMHVILARNASAEDRLEDALDWIDTGLEQYPGNVSLRYQRALVLQQQQRMRRALNLLESLAEENPDNAMVLNALGYLLTDHFDRNTEAREYIQRALALSPDSPAIIDSMGWVLYKLGDYEAALGYLRRAYRLETDPEIAAHLVDTHWALEQRDSARELLSRALERSPDSPHLQEVRERIGQ